MQAGLEYAVRRIEGRIKEAFVRAVAAADRVETMLCRPPGSASTHYRIDELSREGALDEVYGLLDVVGEAQKEISILSSSLRERAPPTA